MAEPFFLTLQIRRARADFPDDLAIQVLDHRERLRMVQSLTEALGVETAKMKNLDTADPHEEAWVDIVFRGFDVIKENLPYISTAVSILTLWKKSKRAAHISVTTPAGARIDIDEGDPDMVTKILKAIEQPAAA